MHCVWGVACACGTTLLLLHTRCTRSAASDPLPPSSPSPSITGGERAGTPTTAPGTRGHPCRQYLASRLGGHPHGATRRPPERTVRLPSRGSGPQVSWRRSWHAAAKDSGWHRRTEHTPHTAHSTHSHTHTSQTHIIDTDYTHTARTQSAACTGQAFGVAPAASSSCGCASNMLPRSRGGEGGGLRATISAPDLGILSHS